MIDKIWIIEARVDGALDFKGRQPEEFFGHDAITGITEDAMAKAIYRALADRKGLYLDGRNIQWWPALIDERWVARRKTW